MSERYICYDFETLKHCITVIFKDCKTGAVKEFVIHESRDDFLDLLKCLKKIGRMGYWMVGFNNVGFDGQIVQYILENQEYLKTLPTEDIIFYIYEESQRIIHLPEDQKYLFLIPEWKLAIRQIDLFKQKHYDSRNKYTSLKWLQFTMRMHNIASMPISHDANEITEEDVVKILGYNLNDVEATYKNFELNKFETDLRHNLSSKYHLSLMNASEPRLARDIFGKFLSDSMGIPTRQLKERRTYRTEVKIKDLIFPYVQFKDRILKGAKQFFEDTTVNPYTYRKEGIDAYKKIFKFGNIYVDIGLGGIHGCINAGVYESRPDHVIHDMDATSYYPMLGIRNNLYPEHLSQKFCVIYEDLFNLRKEIPKEEPDNYAYKIILNAAYGLSQQPDNYFHDPNYTFAITVNGQLLLLMLAELLRVRIPDIVFYQFNTDGITIGYDPKHSEEVKRCMKRWETLTKISLEDKFYTKMVIRDVNAYMALDTKGKVKRKNVFAYSLKPEDKEMEYHKNLSFLVIPKALEAFFIYGKDYEQYIYECKDIFDFCGAVKVTKDFDLTLHSFNAEEVKIDKETIHQQVVRYYVGTEFTSLKKKYKPTSKMGVKASAKGKSTNYTEVEAGWNLTYFNVYEEKPMQDYKINYKYYIKEVRKIVDAIQPNRKQLKLEL